MTAAPGTAPAPSVTDGGWQLFDWLRTMRDEHPVHEDQYGVFHVYRYADVRTVSNDYGTYSSDLSRLRPDSDALSEQILSVIDPPMHRRLRTLVSQAFTARAVAALEPRIVEIAEELLDRVEGDSFDLVRDFAYPLPVIVIAELLGVPAEDRVLFRTWSEQMLSVQVDDAVDMQFGDDAGEDYEEKVRRPLRELHAYLQAHVDDRRARPTSDLISGLIAASDDGERLTDRQIVEFAALLLMAGHVSTSMMLSNAVQSLEENPGIAAEVRADRSLLGAVVEETMRFRSPITIMARVTTTDTVLAGIPIPAGRMVTPSVLSANHDERHFPDPDRFDITRGSSQQLAFGHGIHYCLGAPLARMEGRLALDALLGRFADLRIDPDAEIAYHHQGLFGARALPVLVRH